MQIYYYADIYPLYYYDTSGFWVVFRKDIINTDYLQSFRLNDRQIKAVLFVKEKGKITNSEYQTLNKISKRTATSELTELVGKYALFKRLGTSGSGILYKIVGQ